MIRGLGMVLVVAAALAAQEVDAAPARKPVKAARAAPDSAQVLALLEGVRNPTCPLPGVATGGQPDAARLAALGQAGFKTVLDLRTPEEARGFDEPKAVRAAGLAYRTLPVGHDGVPDRTFDRFRALMSDPKAHPVLVHCASGNRVGPVMIAWLVLDRGWQWDRAVEAAKAGGLRSPELEAAARAYVERRRD